MISYNRQPPARTAYNPVLPRPNFLFNAAAGPVDLITGNIFQTVAGAPLAQNTEKGFGYKSWEANASIVPTSSSSSRRAMLAIFYVTNPATDGVILCSSSSTNGSQLRMVSGVLQYRPPSTSSANIASTATISAGKTYVAFGYSIATGTADRHIWVNGLNTDGTSTTGSAAGLCDTIRFGQTPAASTLVPDITLLAAANWANHLFTEDMASFISNNPWSIFKKPNTHAVALPGLGTTANLLRGPFSKLLGGKL